MDLETSWTGATWRTFPPPPIGTADDPGTPRPRLSAAQQQRARATWDRVWAAVPGTYPLKVQVIADRAGVHLETTRHVLNRMVIKGLVDMTRERRSQMTGAPQSLFQRSAR
jgi:predicted ArsR family transcriptional regulator